MSAPQAQGMVSLAGRESVDATVEKLTSALQSGGISIFAIVDHSGEAQKVGMAMPPTKLLIFGNPKAGTPVMLAGPTVAIDLPLKILVWEDKDGQVWVSYNSAQYLEQRHGIREEFLGALEAAGNLAKAAAGA